MASITSRAEGFSHAVVPGSAADLRYAAIAQHCILLEGPVVSTEAVLSLLLPYLRRPVTWNWNGTPLALPPDGGGALILRNVAGLTPDEQARLKAWLTEPTRQTQVVSTTVSPLFPLVNRHQFDSALYYLLSVVRYPLDQT